MKIVRIVPYLDFGGVEKRLELTAKGFLDYKQHELIIIVLSKNGKVGELIKAMGYEVISLGGIPKIPKIRLIYQLYNIFKSKNPEVIHCSGSEANFHGLWAGWLLGVPVRIGEEIGFPNHDWRWKFIFKITYSLATKVIAISEAVKDKIVEMGEINKRKVQVIYNPVDLWNFDIPHKRISGVNSFSRLRYQEGKENLNPNSFVIVTTCRLVPVKNLDLLIKVFNQLVSDNPRKEMKLWIVGDGPEKKSLEKLVSELEIGDNVLFTGFQENVSRFLNQADVFILPSFSEGFSISLVEAMASGLPSIATNVGGPSEIIKKDTGYLISPSNENDILDKIQKVIYLSKYERWALGQRAKEDVEKRFSIEKYIENLLACYQDLRN